MFAVGVDEMSWDDLNDTRYDWPGVAAVRDYRRAARGAVDQLIRTQPLTLPIGWEDPFWIVLMGIEHERIHLETSSVLIRQHRLKYVQPHPAWAPCRDSGVAPDNALVDIPAAAFGLGRDRSAPQIYGWDNEFGTSRGVEPPAFQASRYLVSNQEFLAFVDAGGYADDSLWQEEGRRLEATSPAPNTRPSGCKDGSEWRLRLMLEEVPMPWDWPVETNCHEAKAFCPWKARTSGQPVRLPSEDEWQALRRLRRHARSARRLAAGQSRNSPTEASSCPVNRFAHGQLFDVVGNVWQWLETPIYPFAGFAVHPIYDDFTTPTFDERHNLIKGGSWISCGNEAAPASRYAFRRHFFQHAGFRYVVAGALAIQPGSHYETDAPDFGIHRIPLRRRILRRAQLPARAGATRHRQRGATSQPARRWTSAAPPAAPASNWPAISTTSPASTSRPALSASAPSWPNRAGYATRWPKKAIWSATRNARWPTSALRRSRRKSSSSRATPATSSRSSPATTSSSPPT